MPTDVSHRPIKLSIQLKIVRGIHTIHCQRVSSRAIHIFRRPFVRRENTRKGRGQVKDDGTQHSDS
jgi:hypothetical protein